MQDETARTSAGFDTLPEIQPAPLYRPPQHQLRDEPPAADLLMSAAPGPVLAAAVADGGRRQISDGDLAALRTCLPNLCHLSDDYVRNTDTSLLLALNATAGGPTTAAHSAAAAAAAAAHYAGAARPSQDPAVKMAKNLEALRETPTKVIAGLDNRVDALHPARFLAGVVCSSKKLWLAAREVIGMDGLVPLATYDMVSAGLGNCVTPRGLYELHRPGSSALQIKMFSSVNLSTSAVLTRRVTLADNDSAIDIGDGLKEILDLDTLQRACRALCTAAQLVCPWNHSFLAIQGFLHTAQFGGKDLPNNADRIPALVDFINTVFSLNANAWIQKEPYLAAGELKATWLDFIANRPSALLNDGSGSSGGGGYYNRGGGAARGGRPWRGHSSNSSPYTTSGPLYPNTAVPPPTQPPLLICRNYNLGTCRNHHSDCKLFSGDRAHHVCDVFRPNGKQCRGFHSRANHK